MSEYGRSEKAVGEPDAGNPPVRFDEGAVETGVSAKGMHGAPLLYSTDAVITTVFSGESDYHGRLEHIRGIDR